MDKSIEIKRKHHFIWSRYLRSWAKDKDVYYLTKKGNISFDSVAGLACERDFYKINSLTEIDINYILQWSNASTSPYLKKLHHSYLSMFVNLTSLSENASNDFPKDIHLKKVIMHNSLENLHSYFENGVVDILRNLTAGNGGILKDDDSMLKFCAYLGHQISRTKRMKTKSIETVYKHTPPQYKFLADLLEKNWWFISYMLGLNIGVSFFESRSKENHIYIKNNTTIPFITGDNPCVNIHECLEGKDPLTPPEKGDFFFPLSPKYGYMINESDKYNYLSESIDPEMVRLLNRKIALNREYYLFSSTSDSIREATKKDA
ncbi:MAG: DUF4238 domain-containing protein [Vibrio sp.]